MDDKQFAHRLQQGRFPEPQPFANEVFVQSMTISKISPLRRKVKLLVLNSPLQNLYNYL
jgi:hypothetical protein